MNWPFIFKFLIILFATSVLFTFYSVNISEFSLFPDFSEKSFIKNDYTFLKQIFTKNVYIPTYDKYISTQTPCARLGNQLLRYAEIYGIGRVVGRTPFFNYDMECEIKSLPEIKKTFPNFYNHLKIIKPNPNETYFTTAFNKCCDYSRIENVQQKYLTFNYRWPFFYKLFDKYKDEIKYLFQYGDNITKEVINYGENFFGNDTSHKFCIHFRRGDFVGRTRFFESKSEFINPAANEIFSYLQKQSISFISIVLIGKDDKFVKKLKFDDALFTAIYPLNLPSRDHDLAFANNFCDSFLLSSSGSTFGWWIGYLLPETTPIFFNGMIQRNRNFNESEIDEFYPKYWKRITMINETASILN